MFLRTNGIVGALMLSVTSACGGDPIIHLADLKDIKVHVDASAVEDAFFTYATLLFEAPSGDDCPVWPPETIASLDGMTMSTSIPIHSGGGPCPDFAMFYIPNTASNSDTSIVRIDDGSSVIEVEVERLRTERKAAFHEDNVLTPGEIPVLSWSPIEDEGSLGVLFRDGDGESTTCMNTACSYWPEPIPGLGREEGTAWFEVPMTARSPYDGTDVEAGAVIDGDVVFIGRYELPVRRCEGVGACRADIFTQTSLWAILKL